MNHTRYQDWLFELSEGPLGPEQVVALDAHLRDCPDCRSLAESWGHAERSLRRAELAAPQPGFSQRWQARLAQSRQRLHRRQTIAVLSAGSVGVLLLLVILATLAWPWLHSPSLLLWAWVYQVFGIYLAAAQTGRALQSVFSELSGAISLVIWIFALGLFSMLSVLWVVSYRILTNPRRIMK